MTELADHQHHSNEKPKKIYGLDSIAFGQKKEPEITKQSQRNMPKQPGAEPAKKIKKRKKKWQVRKEKLKEDKEGKRRSNNQGKRKRVKLDPEDKFEQQIVAWLETKEQTSDDDWVDIAHVGDKCKRPKGFAKSWRLGLWLSKRRQTFQVDSTGKNVRLLS
jgi:hypothetical protein